MDRRCGHRKAVERRGKFSVINIFLYLHEKRKCVTLMENGSIFSDGTNRITPRNECIIRQEKKQNDIRIHTKLNRKQKKEIWGPKRKIGEGKKNEILFLPSISPTSFSSTVQISQAPPQNIMSSYHTQDGPEENII